MSFDEFLGGLEEWDKSLISVRPNSARPLQQLLDESFIESPVDVTESDFPEDATEAVLLVEDGEVTASSSFEAIHRSILSVNAEAFTTDGQELDSMDVPDVVEGVEAVPFHLTGYPEGNRQKVLLTAISRYVEKTALEHGLGTHRASFQRLSRIDDEFGTRNIYDRLASSGVDTHLYGVPDWMPEGDPDLVVHGGYNDDFQRTWFVIYLPPEGVSGEMGLVARETERGRWRGFWTRDRRQIEEVEDYIAYHM